MKTPAKIILIEDDPDLGTVLKQYLETSDFEVRWFQKPSDFLATSDLVQTYDIAILDVMLPEMSGFDLSKEIRKTSSIPFLFLTAKGQSIDRILGLKLGAADYISKPCEPEELILRINNILRRENLGSAREIKIGSYFFVPSELLLKFQEHTFLLTEKESELLQFLILYNHKIVSRQEILETIWGANDYFMGRSLDVFMTRLRKYFKHDESVRFESVRGVGFKVDF